MLLSFLAVAAAVSSIHIGFSSRVPGADSHLGRSFRLFTLCFAFWALPYAFVFIAPDDASFMTWYRISAIGWCGIVPANQYLTLAFGTRIRRRHLAFILVSGAYFSFCAISIATRNSFVTGRIPTALGNAELIDARRIGYYLFGVPATISTTWSIASFARSIAGQASSKSIKRSRGLLALIVCVLMPGLGANMALYPLFGIVAPSLGVFGAYLLLASSFFLITKYRPLGLDDMRLRVAGAVDSELLFIRPDGFPFPAESIEVGGGAFQLGKELQSGAPGLEPVRRGLAAAKSGHESVDVRIERLVDGRNRRTQVRVTPIFDEDEHGGWILSIREEAGCERMLEESGLSPQEKRVAFLILEGCPTKEIASRMRLSPGTVKNYTSSVFRKTGARGRGDLMRSLLGPS
jgi:DNA-binding CsgD family transcriptional regulator